MTSQLPASALPLDTEISPLARYLASVCGARKQLGLDMVPAIVEGAVALASAHPFDVEERLLVPNGDNPYECSLLGGVLMLYPFAHRAGTRIAWPLTVEEFGADQLASSNHFQNHLKRANVEWFAALLTAAGCNPWHSKANADVLPADVHDAVHSGLGGLVERFLVCPDAWSAQEVADASPTQKAPPWWSELTRVPTLLPVLEVLLENGARLKDPGVWFKCMEYANADAVETVSKHPGFTPSEADLKKLKATWKTRLKAKQITPEEFERMGRAFYGATAQEEFDPISAEIAQRLSDSWGKQPNGSASQAYDYAGDLGIKNLTSIRRLRGGLMSGQWSLLGACAAERIRAADEKGALGWSIARMLKTQFDQGKRAWSIADPASPEFKGKLAPALGFDWRPGIAIDGIVALSLLGQVGPNPSGESPAVEQKRQTDLFIEWEGFSQATGISDIRGWARQHAGSSIAFTTQMLKTPHHSVTKCLLRTWNAAVVIDPELLEHVSLQNRQALLSALHGRFQACIGWGDGTKQAFWEVGKVITGGLTPDSLTGKTPLNTDRLQMAVELAMVPTQLTANVIEAIIKRGDELTDETLQRIEWRCQAQLKTTMATPDLAPLLSFARSRRLEIAFQGSTLTSDIRPRL